jgi:hypothetical protein
MFTSLGLFDAPCPDTSCHRPRCIFSHGGPSRVTPRIPKPVASPLKRKIEATSTASKRNAQETSGPGEVKRVKPPTMQPGAKKEEPGIRKERISIIPSKAKAPAQAAEALPAVSKDVKPVSIRSCRLPNLSLTTHSADRFRGVI